MSTGTLIERAGLLAALLCSAACESTELPDVEFKTHCDGRDLIPCNLRDTACARIFFDYTACLRDRENVAMPELRFVPPEAFSTEPPLAAPVSSELQRALALVDLLENPLALRSGYLGHGGPIRYSPAERAFLIAEGDVPLIGFDPTMQFIHEAVHAMQDAEHDFSALANGRDRDQRLALEAVLDGEAFLMRELVQAAAARVSIYQWPPHSTVAGELDRLSSQAALLQPSPFTAAPSSFSQTVGLLYVLEAWFNGQQAAVDRLLEAPPPSTAAMMRGPAFSGQEARPLELTLPALEPGAERVEAFALGRWFYELTLLRATGEERSAVDARAASLAWDGDQFMVWRSADETIAAVWIIRALSEADAARAVAVFAATPVGYQASRRFAAVGKYFVLVAAEDESRLDAWSAAVETGLRD